MISSAFFHGFQPGRPLTDAIREQLRQAACFVHAMARAQAAGAPLPPGAPLATPELADTLARLVGSVSVPDQHPARHFAAAFDAWCRRDECARVAWTGVELEAYTDTSVPDADALVFAANLGVAQACARMLATSTAAFVGGRVEPACLATSTAALVGSASRLASPPLLIWVRLDRRRCGVRQFLLAEQVGHEVVEAAEPSTLDRAVARLVERRRAS